MSTQTIRRRMQILQGEARIYSLTRPGTEVQHKVEYDETSGQFQCSCEHHQFRVAPKLRKGEAVEACKHVKRYLVNLNRLGQAGHDVHKLLGVSA